MTQDTAELSLVVLHSFEILLLVVEFCCQYLVHILGPQHFPNFGRSWVRLVAVGLGSKDGSGGLETLLDGDGVGIEEGEVAGEYNFVVLLLLLLVEAVEFALVVPDLLDVDAVVLLVLLDAEGEVGELEVLLLQPVDQLDVVVVAGDRLVLLQLLLLVLQRLQVLLYLLDALR